MKAQLVYWHKARLLNKYALEMEIHRVGKSAKYPEGIKYGLILKNLHNGDRVLMDNHHPKGPHVHLNAQEVPYHYVDEGKLIEDFKNLVLTHMEVKI